MQDGILRIGCVGECFMQRVLRVIGDCGGVFRDFDVEVSWG
jgi:aspartate aminotransferase-like enzyme